MMGGLSFQGWGFHLKGKVNGQTIIYFSRGWIYPSSANLLKLQGELITPPLFIYLKIRFFLSTRNIPIY
jgi:hypothetical protein